MSVFEEVSALLSAYRPFADPELIASVVGEELRRYEEANACSDGFPGTFRLADLEKTDLSLRISSE